MTAAEHGVRPSEELVCPARELLVERRPPGILLVTLARPDRRNSLSEAMLDALQGAIDQACHDRELGAVVIAAQGTVFSAGHDLKELTAWRAQADAGRAATARMMRTCATLMRSIVDCPKPVIAAVQGMASAAGCQLVATCDLALASQQASFCTPGVNIGLFCSTPMVALSRNVTRKRAMEMLLLGDVLSAREAAHWGLVNRVVPAETLLVEALALAGKIAAKPPYTIATCKAAFYRQIEMGLGEAYDYAAGVMVENMLHAEAKEGIGAFIEKKKPSWVKD
jgi:enoyl-CoA hydratase/carnithine racemase